MLFPYVPTGETSKKQDSLTRVPANSGLLMESR